jgi:hypothetical protein
VFRGIAALQVSPEVNNHQRDPHQLNSPNIFSHQLLDMLVQDLLQKDRIVLGRLLRCARYLANSGDDITGAG